MAVLNSESLLIVDVKCSFFAKELWFSVHLMRELYTSEKVIITLILHLEISVGSHRKFIVLKKIVCAAEVDEICVD